MTAGALRSEMIGTELSNTATVAGMGEKPFWEAPVFECCWLRKVDLSGLSRIAEDWIHLLGDSDKSSSPT